MSPAFVFVFLLFFPLFFPPLSAFSCLLATTSSLLPALLLLSFFPDFYSCPSNSTSLPSSFDTDITPVLPLVTLAISSLVFSFLCFALLLSLPPRPPPPSQQTAICSSVNGRMLCGCDVVWLWSVCTATVVHSAYHPAASPCLDPAGCLAGWTAGWLTDCCIIEAVEQLRASLSLTVINYPVATETQANRQSHVCRSVFDLMPPVV